MGPVDKNHWSLKGAKGSMGKMMANLEISINICYPFQYLQVTRLLVVSWPLGWSLSSTPAWPFGVKFLLRVPRTESAHLQRELNRHKECQFGTEKVVSFYLFIFCFNIHDSSNRGGMQRCLGSAIDSNHFVLAITESIVHNQESIQMARLHDLNLVVTDCF
jgi:hypothetical protein